MGISHNKPTVEVKRDAKGLWIGSGNPLGKPVRPVPTYLEVARQASQEAIETLVRAMREADDWEMKCRAANSILDRAYGKPLQQSEISANGEISVMVKMLLGGQQAPAIEHKDDAAD